MAAKISVGDVAKDGITGFAGVVICSTFWLNGCERLTLQPQKIKDGKPLEAMTFDAEQCVLVKATGHRARRDTGGPRPEPTRSRNPR